MKAQDRYIRDCIYIDFSFNILLTLDETIYMLTLVSLEVVHGV